MGYFWLSMFEENFVIIYVFIFRVGGNIGFWELFGGKNLLLLKSFDESWNKK